MNLSMFDSRHKWFDRAISILNIKNEEAISIYDALIEFNNRGYKVSKIPSTAKSSLCNVITSSYMSSHNGITMSNRETILHLMQYKEIFLNTSVAYKNNNYFAISVSASYAGSDLINYLIYDIDTAADQLATPLHAVSILEDIDLQTGKKLKDDGEFLTVEFSDAIYLKLDKKSLQIKACFQSYPSCPEHDADRDTEYCQHNVFPVNIGTDFRIIKSEYFQGRKLPAAFCDIDFVQIVQYHKGKQSRGNNQYHDNKIQALQHRI